MTSSDNNRPGEVERLRAALEAIDHSVTQAAIFGNDWRRELRLIANIVTAALTQQEKTDVE